MKSTIERPLPFQAQIDKPLTWNRTERSKFQHL